MANREAAATDPVQVGDDGLSAAVWQRNLYAITIAQALAIIGFTLRESFLPFYLRDLGAESTREAVLWTGWINAGGFGVMVVAQPIWGWVSDRRGRKPMLLRAMFAAMVTVGLMGFATEPWHLLGLRMVEGAFTGTVAASTALVASSAPRARLGYSLGLVQTAVFSGASLGPFLGGVLSVQIGYRATFVVSGVILGAAGALVWLLVTERFVPAARGPLQTAGSVSRRAWLLAPVLASMIGVLFVVRFAQNAVRPILPLYIEAIGDLSDERAASVAGITFAVLGASSAVSAVVTGKWGDAIGHRRILLISVVAAGLLYLPMALAGAPWQLIALQGLFGIAAGGLIPAANAIVAQVTPAEQRGMTYGVTAAAASAGGFAGPLAGSAVAAWAGFEATFILTGAVLLACAVVLRPRLRPAEDSESPA
jgi:DHA1 family multidrug resistance protein-like MFS transporter